MNIAIDISPLSGEHSVRGSGFYLKNLKAALTKYFPDNRYIFFQPGEQLPESVDVVHYPYFDPFFLTLPYQKKHNTIVTVHDLAPLIFPKHFPAGLRGKLKWHLQKFRLKKADAIITDSICSKNDIAKIAGISKEKIHVVYLAAGEEFTKYQKSNSKDQKLRKKYNLPEKFALYVGDATWNKNLPRIVRAAIEADVPLVMAGKALSTEILNNNPWNSDLQEAQRIAHQSDTVFLLGFVPDEDLVSLYNAATVFVMPSLYEGFGLPILEAMSCGCPVITSKEGSLSEVAGDAAYFVDAYSQEDIANGIKKVFLDEKLQQLLSQKGLKQAKKFNWKKTAQETIRVYQTVV